MLRQYAKKVAHHLTKNEYRTLNRVDLDAGRLLHNVALMQRLHPGQQIIPVLKGNAYGHGIEQIAGILDAAPLNLVAVDGYFEAVKIRHITRHNILVMGYILPENAHLLDTKRCSFVVQDEAGLHAFGKLRRPVRVHMELNTGMNRMGLQPSEIAAYLAVVKKYPNLELEGVMTHLADADNARDANFTMQQVASFDAQMARILAAGFQPKYVHIAQTAGSVKAQSKYANALRLGIGTYGINPLSPQDPYYDDLAQLKPVLELKTTIVKVLELQKGDRVSYNGTFTARKPMRVGILPLGYYEGLPRELSNVGCMTYGSHELPVVGRVCMNHTIVDLKDLPLKTGDEVVVISKDLTAPNSIASLASAHHLFPYAVMTGLSSSIARRVV